MRPELSSLGSVPQQRHPTVVALSRPPEAEVDAGTDVVLKAKVSCRHGCDLRDRTVNVASPEGVVVAEARLAEFADGHNETAEFAFTAPDVVGEHSWSVVFPRHEAEGLVHEEASLAITVQTKAHDTSLAVWGVPSPVVVGGPFRIRVGATCTAACDLAGREIQVSDESGRAIASARLGEAPLEGTRALYWTEIDLVAPTTVGTTSRSIQFAPTELRLPHDGASARFGFETVNPPQHSVSFKVFDRDGCAPVEGAQIRLGVYFGYSDWTGVATIAVPRGTYDLDVFKTGYEAPSRILTVNDDVIVEIEVLSVPAPDPDAHWLFDPAKRVETEGRR